MYFNGSRRQSAGVWSCIAALLGNIFARHRSLDAASRKPIASYRSSMYQSCFCSTFGDCCHVRWSFLVTRKRSALVYLSRAASRSRSCPLRCLRQTSGGRVGDIAELSCNTGHAGSRSSELIGCCRRVVRARCCLAIKRRGSWMETIWARRITSPQSVAGHVGRRVARSSALVKGPDPAAESQLTTSSLARTQHAQRNRVCWIRCWLPLGVAGDLLIDDRNFCTVAVLVYGFAVFVATLAISAAAHGRMPWKAPGKPRCYVGAVEILSQALVEPVEIARS